MSSNVTPLQGTAKAVAPASTQPSPAAAAPRCAPAWRAPLLLLIAGLVACALFPDQLGLITRIFVMGLFVLSLDLVVGVAGLATLGHAAMFGVGAYAAGIFALHVHADPLLGLAIGILAGAAIAMLSGAFLLRYEGFTFLMLTVAVSQILLNLAQKARDWTGGDDGLSGYTMQPLLGKFAFDLEGKVGAVYALVVLVVLFYGAQRLVQSPFGLAVRGIHENRARMAALGTPVFRRLWLLYTVAGALAGAAGALSAQINTVVGTDSLSFAVSAEALVMLILGGAGHLTGALAGAAVFTLLHHTASSINPYHWLFVVGGLLMLVVLVTPAKAWAWLRQRAGGAR